MKRSFLRPIPDNKVVDRIFGFPAAVAEHRDQLHAVADAGLDKCRQQAGAGDG